MYGHFLDERNVILLGGSIATGEKVKKVGEHDGERCRTITDNVPKGSRPC
jgi:hypothetical protein